MNRTLPNARKMLQGAAAPTRCLPGVLAVFVVLCSLAYSQTAKTPPDLTSELSRQNLDRVAASAGQIEAVLRKDAGLMVELKRWVAKDATDHGQLISDSDLTDQGIFDRLETDVQFRSVATALLQKYGYLLPQLNPESPQAKEQELLIQARVKWLAQDEEEQRSQAREQTRTDLQQATVGCDPRRESNCEASRRASPAEQQAPEIGTPVVPQRSIPPGTNNRPSLPPQDVPSLEQTQLLLPGNEGIENSQSLFGGASTNAAGSAFPGLGHAGPGTLVPASANEVQPPYLRTPSSDFPQTGQGNNLPQSGLITGSQAGMANDGGMSFEPNPSAARTTAGMAGSRTRPEERSSSERYETEDSTFDRDYLNRRRESANLSQAMLRQPAPYVDVPSLYDMYLQAVPHPPSPQRFGMEVFENGTRDSQLIPFDLPVGPDYVVGPGDGLAIDLWGGVSQRMLRTVDRQGRVSLPETGPLLVAGKSLAEVQESVQRTLRSQFRDISADVSLSRLRTIRVYVVGDVLRPGAYDISSLSTPLNALFAAGGPTSQGSLRILEHNRRDQLVQNVDLYDLLLHGVKTDLQRLENGDTVLVPPIGPQVSVEGMVRRPAVYELHDEKSLSQILTLAGGLLPTATLRHIEVQRLVAHDKRTMLSVDIPSDAEPAAIAKELGSFQVQDGDKIRIFPIAPYNQDTLYLEGHVLRPGRYSYHAGMRVTDLISSYKDLLPEPAAQYAEIIRLNAPDYRPTVESFNLGEALSHPATAPLLQPLDTVQIFGRYDFENPPTVSVWGDVRVPGTYRTSGQLHLSDAIHMAGGLSPDAQKEDAQVFRYLPDGQLKIFSVKLGEALAGDAAQNIVLSSRDRVLIHRNPADVEPATVYIRGEVARPGRYPLTTNMTVADLIHAAGGPRKSAELKDADLTHLAWEGQSEISGQHREVELADALAGVQDANLALSNGDVLTIRKLPGWDDLGASITVRGEVTHPGTYGIKPGEKLSSVLHHAGGFTPQAYPYGAVLIRSEVQQLQDKSQTELVERVREQQASLKLAAKTATEPDEKLSDEAAYQQWQSTLDGLMNHPPLGRVVIQISANIKSWAGTSRDITVMAGDKLVVPKRPSYVMVQGQVFNPTAVAYRPGKSGRWYLNQAGGPSNLANKRAIFVIRADGSVVGSHGSSLFSGGPLEGSLQPGDSVVVPEKAIGGPPTWKALFQAVQLGTSITTSAIIAAHY